MPGCGAIHQTPAHNRPIATASLGLRRIVELNAIERSIQGRTADARRQVRNASTRPLIEMLEIEFGRRSTGWSLAEAIRYALPRRPALTRFLDDSRIELDSKQVERALGLPRSGARTMWRGLGRRRPIPPSDPSPSQGRREAHDQRTRAAAFVLQAWGSSPASSRDRVALRVLDVVDCFCRGAALICLTRFVVPLVLLRGWGQAVARRGYFFNSWKAPFQSGGGGSSL